MNHFTASDVEQHQRRSFGDMQCTCSAIGAMPSAHALTCPISLHHEVTVLPGPSKKRGLKKLREPNQTEASYGRILEARLRRGEIISYAFEAVTLRWADMAYTPDFHVCEPYFRERIDTVISEIVPMVHVFIEIKGAHRWEDSIVKWKAFAKGKAFPWARFELHQKEGGQWHRLG